MHKSRDITICLSPFPYTWGPVMVGSCWSNVSVRAAELCYINLTPLFPFKPFFTKRQFVWPQRTVSVLPTLPDNCTGFWYNDVPHSSSLFAWAPMTETCLIHIFCCIKLSRVQFKLALNLMETHILAAFGPCKMQHLASLAVFTIINYVNCQCLLWWTA